MSWQNVPKWQLWIDGTLHAVYLLKEHAEEVSARYQRKGCKCEIREGYRA